MYHSVFSHAFAHLCIYSLFVLPLFLFFDSGKTMFLVLSKEDAVAGWRSVMGPTDPTEAKDAAPDT